MAMLKTALKYILTFPQSVSHKLKGVDVRYADLVTFFRYFPFGKISQSDEILGALISEKDRVHVDGADFCTLNDVVERNNLSQDAVLKIDVDGYEYEILRSAERKSLNRFSHIAMEYHFGIQDIVSILESAGFETEIKPVNCVSISYHPESFRNMEIGMIYAERVREL